LNIAVYSPHCDDAVLGCGGSINKWCHAGHTVSIVYFTDGYSHPPKNRCWHLEMIGSVETLGVNRDNIYRLGLLNQRFDEYTLIDINKKVERLSLEPDVIVSPTPHDANFDHTVVFRVALVQARPIGKPICHLSMETLSSTEWGGMPFRPELYVPVSERDVEAKMAALELFTEEIRAPPHPRNPETVKVKAQQRGVEAGVLLAEAFEVVRLIAQPQWSLL